MVRAARRRGLRMVEIPGAYVRRRDKASTVNGARDSLALLLLGCWRFRSQLRQQSRMKALAEIGWGRARCASASSRRR